MGLARHFSCPRNFTPGNFGARWMRNVWMVGSNLAIVVAICALVYYGFPERPATPAVTASGLPKRQVADGHGLVALADNPLLIANKGQLDRWVPSYPIRCGEILFEKSDPKARHFKFCADEIRRRVSRATEHKLGREEVLDPRVRAHWREVMGGQ
jgi:hypothetical protein